VIIGLTDNVAGTYFVKKNVGDIKPGDYIASTGINGTDGKLHAIEVRIFTCAPRKTFAPTSANSRIFASLVLVRAPVDLALRLTDDAEIVVVDTDNTAETSNGCAGASSVLQHRCADR
jgi:hypothetical protein